LNQQSNQKNMQFNLKKLGADHLTIQQICFQINNCKQKTFNKFELNKIFRSLLEFIKPIKNEKATVNKW